MKWTKIRKTRQPKIKELLDVLFEVKGPQLHILLRIVFASVATFTVFLTANEIDTSPSVPRSEVESGVADAEFVLPDRIEDLKLSSQPFERNVQIASWILDIETDKVAEWLMQSTESAWIVEPKVRTDIQMLLVQRLARSEPEKALNFAMSRFDRDRSEWIEAVFQEWAAADLDGALARAKTLPRWNRNRAARMILESVDDLTPDQKREIARQFNLEQRHIREEPKPLVSSPIETPRKTWYEVVDQAKPDFAHYFDLRDVAIAWIEEAGISVLEEVSTSIVNLEIRKNVLEFTLEELVESSPEQALDQVLAIHFPGRNEVVKEMVIAWAKHDPISALNKVHSAPRSRFRNQLEDHVINAWLGIRGLHTHWEYWGTQPNPNRDPHKLLESLHKLPATIRGKVSSAAIETLARSDPPLEVAEIALQLDESLHHSVAQALVEVWLWQDRDAAIEWATTNKATEDIRDKLLSTLAWELLYREPSLAVEIALKQPIPDHGVGLEGEILTEIAFYDLEIAIELLPKIREGKTKINAYVSVASELLMQRKNTEAIDLGTHLPESVALLYYMRLGAMWAESDPQGFVQAIDRFPTAEARSIVATQQVVWNSSTNWFTEQQIRELRKYISAAERVFLDSQQ